uniref:tetrahydrofolate synthase n=1 Tax=candidate division WOR-3 bacterium TaxID=2052148 RepID=A0A7C4X9T4_UNCW3
MNPEKFLNSLVNYERTPGYKYDLEAYKEFLENLGSPQKNLKNVILIAGTKGKGSTATILSSCLIATGYNVGLFTSPHLKRINERIKVNGQEISNKEMAEFIEAIKPHINFKTKIGARTFFEVLTTIAFFYFALKKVDFAILEVGLGGRLDATNVFHFHIPVITRIGYDHMNLLGNSLTQITYEKAGIIPDNRHKMPDNQKFPLNSPFIKGERRGLVITIHQRPSVELVLKKVARERNHQIIFADELHKIKIKKMALSRTELDIKGKLGNFEASLSLPGRHQIENLQIVLAVLNLLRERGFNFELSKIKKGIAVAKLPGRFEIVSKKPLIIYDVAHNEDSFRALNRNLKLIRNPDSPPLLKEGLEKLYLIFGCSKDKDINYAIKNIFPKAKEILLVRANNPRAMEPIEIYKRAKRYQKNLVIAGSVKRALEYLKLRLDKDSSIIVFGSFYLYSELIPALSTI